MNIKDTIKKYLDTGIVQIHLDGRRAEVQIPSVLKQDWHVCLNFSLRYDIPDFELTDTYIAGTLSFNRAPYYCYIPFCAIWSIQSAEQQQGVVVETNAPPELFDTLKILKNKDEQKDEQKEEADINLQDRKLKLVSYNPDVPENRSTAKFTILDGGRTSKGFTPNGGNSAA